MANMTNTRSRSGRNRPSRRERRAAATNPASTPAQARSTAKVYTTTQPRPAAKVYSTPTKSPAKVYSTPARRSYLGEPTPVDYSGEFRTIRHDLRRILLWASIIIAVMLALAFLPIL